MVAQGCTVRVWVSKGKESAYIPDFAGKTVEQYKNALEKAGISDFNYQFIESKSSYGKANSIVELQVDGKVVHPNDFFSNKDGKKLTVYYVSENSNAPVYTTAVQQETEAPVTTTAAATQAPTTQAPVITEPPTNPPEPQTDAPVDTPVDNPPQENQEG